MTDIATILANADDYDEKSSLFYDESDYEQGNYFRGLAHGLREAVSWLEGSYNDHPPLT